MPTFYVYGLCEPYSDEVRYVGLTPRLKKRFQEHCHSFKSGPRKSGWLRGLLALGIWPEMVILDRSEIRDLALESSWIARLRAEGHRLTNMEDVIRENLAEAASRPKPQATRAKISQAQRGKPKHWSAEGRAAVIEAAARGRRTLWNSMSPDERSEYMRQKTTPAMLLALEMGRRLRHSQ